jgi:hypothetical protein
MNVVPEHFRSATPISDDELERYMTRRERKQLKKKTAGKQNQAHGAVGYKPLTARTEHQQHLIDALNESTQVFAIGPAGTGKTYVLPPRSPAAKGRQDHEDLYCPPDRCAQATRPRIPSRQTGAKARPLAGSDYGCPEGRGERQRAQDLAG